MAKMGKFRVSSALLVMSVICLLNWTRAVQQVTNKDSAIAYLREFGHMPKTGGNYEHGMKSFQDMANRTVTGMLNAKTMEMMNLPRCGMTDHLVTDPRVRRFDARVAWGDDTVAKGITWQVKSFDRSIGKTQTETIMARALQVWEDEADITFRHVTDPNVPVDFNIEWYNGRVAHDMHSGGQFDGPNGVLAHAFFPIEGVVMTTVAGDAHFDGDEDFTDGTPDGINLFQVAAHEFGHSLGLGHSNIDEALMAPFYRGFQPNFQLHTDDIEGIRTLYGANSGRGDGTMRPYPGQPAGGTCPGTNIDAVTSIDDGRTYIFKDNQVWELRDAGVESPQQINEVFPNLPNGGIDAAFYCPGSRRTYFFMGSSYYKYFNLQFQGQDSISDNFVGVPNDLDAAFVWSGNGRIYLTKGDQYYRVTYNYWSRYWGSAPFNLDAGYPRPLSVWNLSPGFEQVDGAFQWRSRSMRTYFLSGDQVLRFNDREFGPEQGYPMNTNLMLFGCDEASLIDGGDGNSAPIVNMMPCFLLLVVSGFLRLIVG